MSAIICQVNGNALPANTIQYDEQISYGCAYDIASGSVRYKFYLGDELVDDAIKQVSASLYDSGWFSSSFVTDVSNEARLDVMITSYDMKSYSFDMINRQVVPEPATLVLVSIGLVAMMRRKCIH